MRLSLIDRILGLIKPRDWLVAELPYLVALQTSSIFIIDVISCYDLSVHITLLRAIRQATALRVEASKSKTLLMEFAD